MTTLGAAGTMLCACAVPAEYMGIATRAPVLPAERALIEASLAQGEGPSPAPDPATACPWPGMGGELVTVPCPLLPASQLAGLAWAGNKPAALELGIRFEEGRGLGRDVEKARKLYRIASLSTGGLSWIYSPGVGDAPGQILPLYAPDDPGLAEARTRLTALEPAAGERPD